MPTHIERLDIHIPKTKASGIYAEFGDFEGTARRQRSVRNSQDYVRHEIPTEEFVVRNVIENILVRPEPICSGDTVDGISIRAIQCARRIIDGEVPVGNARVWNRAGVKTPLSRHILPLLLCQRRRDATQTKTC